jgi:hypothetical protein
MKTFRRKLLPDPAIRLRDEFQTDYESLTFDAKYLGSVKVFSSFEEMKGFHPLFSRV